MKRILTLFITAVIVVTLCLSEAIAQNKVTGVVVDKHGSPVPGAMVNAKGTAVKAVTGMDGTFSIDLPYNVKKLTFRYGGYGTVSKTVTPEMQVKMRKSNGTHNDNWFLSFQIAVPDVKQARPAYGFMAGWCRGFGAYMKGVWSGGVTGNDILGGHYDGVMNNDWYEPSLGWITGDRKTTYNAMSVGGMGRIFSCLYACAGIGCAWRDVYYQVAGEEYYLSSGRDSFASVAFDLGMLLRWECLILNVGLIGVPGYGCTGSFGIGYCF